MNETVTIPREEYEIMKRKAELYDEEELTPEELAQVDKAAKGPHITHEEFVKRHPEYREL
jgi:hypothetical protein